MNRPTLVRHGEGVECPKLLQFYAAAARCIHFPEKFKTPSLSSLSSSVLLCARVRGNLCFFSSFPITDERTNEWTNEKDLECATKARWRSRSNVLSPSEKNQIISAEIIRMEVHNKSREDTEDALLSRTRCGIAYSIYFFFSLFLEIRLGR